MAATSSERVLYAAKSRKWNSTQNNKFPSEFPTEHTANIEWIKKTEEENARRVEEEGRAREELLRNGGELQRKDGETGGRNRKRGEGRGKWIILGIVGVIIAMRAWQRYKENTL